MLLKPLTLVPFFLFWVLIGTAAYAVEVSLLDQLGTSWDEPETFITLGACASAPAASGLYTCSPAQLAWMQREASSVSIFASGTESSLGIADSLRRDEVDAKRINALLSEYNHSHENHFACLVEIFAYL